MSDGVMTYEDWLRGCVHHDGRHGYVTLPCDEVLKIADFIERLRADRKTENSSEKPNNCERITEDGVTCAKYPACDDCLDNPLNKLKGSERLVKGSEQTEPQNCDTCRHHFGKDFDIECEVKVFGNECRYEPKDEPQFDKDINVRSKDEPQDDAEDQFCIEHNCPHFYQFGGCMNQGDCPYDEDEPQTERSE